MIDPTPEQIAEANAYWSSLIGQADRLASRANRLFRLCKLNAPAIVIEQSRQLVAKSLMVFPIDAEGAAAVERVNSEIQQREQEFLLLHGYYDDGSENEPGADTKGWSAA